MKKILLMTLFAAGIVQAEQLVSDRADHAILVTIESEPQGAEIWSIPSSTNEEAVKIGTTPYVAPVELRWGTGWMRKKWDKLRVKTVGDICTSAYDKKDKSYVLTLKFVAKRQGYMDEVVDEPLTAFAHYEDLDYDFLKGIPKRQALTVALAPVSSQEAPAPVKKSAPTTIVMAGEGDKNQEDFGHLRLDANVSACEVIVDGKPAGTTPAKLMLREGDHDVVVQKRGYRMYQSEVNISANSEVALKVKLEPAE